MLSRTSDWDQPTESLSRQGPGHHSPSRLPSWGHVLQPTADGQWGPLQRRRSSDSILGALGAPSPRHDGLPTKAAWGGFADGAPALRSGSECILEPAPSQSSYPDIASHEPHREPCLASCVSAPFEHLDDPLMIQLPNNFSQQERSIPHSLPTAFSDGHSWPPHRDSPYLSSPALIPRATACLPRASPTPPIQGSATSAHDNSCTYPFRPTIRSSGGPFIHMDHLTGLLPEQHRGSLLPNVGMHATQGNDITSEGSLPPVTSTPPYQHMHAATYIDKPFDHPHTVHPMLHPRRRHPEVLKHMLAAINSSGALSSNVDTMSIVIVKCLLRMSRPMISV
jgi:hypothetical protein